MAQQLPAADGAADDALVLEATCVCRDSHFRHESQTSRSTDSPPGRRQEMVWRFLLSSAVVQPLG